MLLQAAKVLVEQKKINLELVIVGDGNRKNKLVDFVVKNNLQKIIKIIKFNSNPFNLISQADLFILTSKFEGLPNVLLEAITLNKFVISSDCRTGPKEILLDGKGGLLCKLNSSDDLVKKILFFQKNKKKCTKMLQLARKNLYRFDYNKNLHKYFHLINQF